MTAKTHALPPLDPVLERQLRTWDSRPGERAALMFAAAVAVVFHLVFFFVRLPERTAVVPAVVGDGPVAIYRITPPPPPPPERRRVESRPTERLLPVPESPVEPQEPMDEPALRFDASPLVFDPDPTLGLPTAPPAAGPLRPGIDGVTEPVLIEATKSQPQFPELARRAGIEGSVILRAVILADGTVSDLEVIRCDRERFGFEDAALQAVRQWRYEPATLNGRPVAVHFTVYVTFTLQ